MKLTDDFVKIVVFGVFGATERKTHLAWNRR